MQLIIDVCFIYVLSRSNYLYLRKLRTDDTGVRRCGTSLVNLLHILLLIAYMISHLLTDRVRRSRSLRPYFSIFGDLPRFTVELNFRYYAACISRHCLQLT